MSHVQRIIGCAVVVGLVLQSPWGLANDAQDSSETADTRLSFAELAARIRPSLVTIRSRDRDGEENRLGTGFVISDDGLIATNLHVIGEGGAFTVETHQGVPLRIQSIEASDHSLDLALVRVSAPEASPLPALPLSEGKVEQGTQVLAMGNPWGLENSAVSGVVSAFRNLDGKEFIQLAMPIEPGNSGSPVVDRFGRVVGVVNMKSAAEKNVAFAIQIASLRLLIDQPNPVAIENWFRIGALNRTEWSPRFGATWRQRGGRILVSGSGSGFGGRSLCLLERATPTIPFELAVTVKMENEAGAAGLVFHADGQDRHYGFYPSNGRLRLSCFRGPTVYSWQVLRDEPSEFYQPGTWNRLRVRVEADKLLCYVNDELVFESTDRTFTAGKVGLAKFRDTVAEFKSFQVGRTAAPAMTADQLANALTAVDGLREFDNPTVAELDSLTTTAAASVKLLRSRALGIERQASELQRQAERHRRLANDIHVRHVASQLGELVHGDGEIDLLRGALLIAQLEEEDIDIDAYVRQVDEMARQVESSWEDQLSEDDKLKSLAAFLFTERGYHGSRFEYHHRANSFMNRVIDDREGLPITLSLLFMEVGRRVGLRIEGVGLPGHFVVRYVPSEGDAVLIDPFHGGERLTPQDAAKLVRTRSGQRLVEEHLAAATKPAILFRMLMNLYGLAERESDRESMLRFLEGAVAVLPDSVQHRGLRAVLRRSTGRKAAAIADIDWILQRQPDNVDLDEIRRMRRIFERE